VYRALLDDLSKGAATGPGGHAGNVSDSSATGSQPDTGSSDKLLPGPATTNTTTGIPKAS
jgi:transposase